MFLFPFGGYMEEDKRNLVLFFIVSILIMWGCSHFFDRSRQIAMQQVRSVSTSVSNNVSASSILQNAPKDTAAFEFDEAKEPQNIEINSANLNGIISTRGVKIENVSLKKYSETLDKTSSQKVSVFGNRKGEYYAYSGWKSEDASVRVPTKNTVWDVVGDNLVLSENNVVKLKWDNKSGLSFERTISVDEDYMMTITDTAVNYGKNSIPLRSIAVIHREFDKDSDERWTSYEGPLGCFNGKVEEVEYKEIVKNGEIKHKTTDGWFGITDKYWLVAFVPDKDISETIGYRHKIDGKKNVYEVETSCDTIVLSPNSAVTRTYNLFTGAKEIKTLDMYEKKLGVKHFDLAIDFGWLYLITKPLLYIIAFIKDIVGNMGLGILLITLLIKLILLPLSNKSYRSMNRLRELQPKIKALQKKYAGDNVKLGQEVSAIYQKEGVNPLGGCLPTLLQSPVLFALYKVLYISIEMRQAPFFGWIQDLSLPDPLNIFTLCGLIPITLPGFLQIGIWPFIMGLSMYLQQKISPAPADPSQASMMLIMPIMFTFMFAQFPAGLVIYWTFSNLLSMIHQYVVMRIDDRQEKSKKNG